MKSIKLLFAIAAVFSMLSFTSESPESDNKIVLSSLSATNCSIETMANNIEDHIAHTSHGYMWPVTKMVFSKLNDKVIVTVTAIDNSWFQLFGASEKPYGYLVAKGRLYIVSSIGEGDAILGDLFKKTGTIRAFNRPEMTIALFKKSPVWIYELKDGVVKEVNKFDLDLLSKGDPEYN